MQLYLIRHPRPRDAGGICYGRLDVAVEATAVTAAEAHVHECISAAVLQEAAICSSPLSRCTGLARALAGPREVVVADDLIEMDFGNWEGRAWESVARDELDAWARDIWGYHPGGGENARAVALRWQRWLDQLQGTRSDAAIAITHAGVIRVALERAGRLSASDFARAPIEFASVHCVTVEFDSPNGSQRAEARA
jgi:alpha-ribazole phosphatase